MKSERVVAAIKPKANGVALDICQAVNVVVVGCLTVFRRTLQLAFGVRTAAGAIKPKEIEVAPDLCQKHVQRDR